MPSASSDCRTTECECDRRRETIVEDALLGFEDLAEWRASETVRFTVLAGTLDVDCSGVGEREVRFDACLFGA